MTIEPKKVWKYRFYMTKECRINDFEFDKDSVKSIDPVTNGVLILLNNGSEYFIHDKYMTHWRLAEEKEYPEITYPKGGRIF